VTQGHGLLHVPGVVVVVCQSSRRRSLRCHPSRRWWRRRPVFEGQHVGIITERDLTAAVAEGAEPVTTPVSDYMTPAPEVLRPDSDLADAAHLMLELGVRHLPIMGGGRLVGVLSMRDVLGADDSHER
jgi:CBS domain-containing protein